MAAAGKHKSGALAVYLESYIRLLFDCAAAAVAAAAAGGSEQLEWVRGGHSA